MAYRLLAIGRWIVWAPSFYKALSMLPSRIALLNGSMATE